MNTYILTDPQITLKFNIMVLDSHFLGLFESLPHCNSPFLVYKLQLMDCVINLHSPNQASHVPHLIGAVFYVLFYMTHILERVKGYWLLFTRCLFIPTYHVFAFLKWIVLINCYWDYMKVKHCPKTRWILITSISLNINIFLKLPWIYRHW